MPDVIDILAKREADDAYSELQYLSVGRFSRELHWSALAFVFVRELTARTGPRRVYE